jgi:cytoplasmic iron level regulating protein YaaA (DUF328/UPF0246 family)
MPFSFTDIMANAKNSSITKKYIMNEFEEKKIISINEKSIRGGVVNNIANSIIPAPDMKIV